MGGWGGGVGNLENMIVKNSFYKERLKVVVSCWVQLMEQLLNVKHIHYLNIKKLVNKLKMHNLFIY